MAMKKVLVALPDEMLKALEKERKEPFSLKSAYKLMHGLKFPNRDISIIMAKCPFCRLERHYVKGDLWKNKEDVEESSIVKQLRNQLAQVTTEKDIVKKLYEELLIQVTKINSNSQQPQKPKDPQMEPVG